MGRLDSRFKALKENGEKALIAYVTAGDPDLAGSRDLVLALDRGGADILELGVPFSDPTADGPVIQAASKRALMNGVCLKSVFDLVSDVRSRSEIPVVLFGYYNPIHAYGPAHFAEDAASHGVDGVLVVDLPFEESGELRQFTDPAGIAYISPIAPTTGEERARKIAASASGFLYYISVTGVTGTTRPTAREIQREVGRLRGITGLPVAVGFGITSAEQAAEIGRCADGIVVGSALVSLIARYRGSSGLIHAVGAFAAELKKAMKRTEGRPSSRRKNQSGSSLRQT
jgi:tryptophan synthase alpha chain